MSYLRFDKSVLEQNGLACPFWKSEPSNHLHSKICFSKGKGWRSLGKLIEHIRRIHTPVYYCENCNYRFKAANTTLKLIEQERGKHLLNCRGQRFEVEATIMNQGQQKALEEVKKIRKGLPKLEKLYEVCGMTEPDTYHVRPLDQAQRQLSMPNAEPQQHLPPPNIFAGFQTPRVISEHISRQALAPPLRKTTLSEHDRATTTEAQASGSAALPLKDSGYESWAQEEGLKVVEPTQSLFEYAADNESVAPCLLCTTGIGRDIPLGIAPGAELEIDAEGESDNEILDNEWYDRSMRSGA